MLTGLNWAAVLFMTVVIGVFIAGTVEEIRDRRKAKKRDERVHRHVSDWTEYRK